MSLSSGDNETISLQRSMLTSLQGVRNLFLPSCVGHGFLDNKGFGKVKVGGATVSSAMQSFGAIINDGKSTAVTYTDSNCFDMNCNPTCHNYTSHNDL